MKNTKSAVGRMSCVVAGLALSFMLAPAASAADAHADHQQPAAQSAAPGGMQGMQGMHAEHMAMLQEAKARAEIEDLRWRYARALDTSNEEAYAAVYTEDGQFGTGANATKGRAALTAMIVGLKKSRADREAKGEPKAPAPLHMEANHTIVFRDADHATYHAYWITMFPAQGADKPPRVGAAGRSIDELIRVNGKWLITTRDVTPQD